MTTAWQVIGVLLSNQLVYGQQYANAWRVAASCSGPHHQFFWDIERLIFITENGTELRPGGDCKIIQSGSVSQRTATWDPGSSYTPGYNASNAWDQGSSIWGGRSNGSYLYLGLNCHHAVNVTIVQVLQLHPHAAKNILVQASVNGSWVTVVSQSADYSAGFVQINIDRSPLVVSTVEAICARACKNRGYCCNDPNVGSNQMISCAQACMMRARGLKSARCPSICHRSGDSGCSLMVDEYSYSFCSRCTDLTNSSLCHYGVNNSSACEAGCAMTPPLLVSPEPSQSQETAPHVEAISIAVSVPLLIISILVAALVGYKLVACKKASLARSAIQGSSLFTPRHSQADFGIDEHQKTMDPSWAAITVRQLNELRDKSIEALGSSYLTATMHDINRAVLQPLCDEFQKPYAHIVNEGELLHVGTFVSHCWSENFNQFVESINKAFQDWPVKPNLWICATALVQSTDPELVLVQVCTGDEPSRTPFTRALSKADKLLIVRNAAIDLYERIWCCWEFFYAHQLGMIHRPGAVLIVGPNTASSKPVDVVNAQSSNPEDKRRILEHICRTASVEEINSKLTQIKLFDGRA